MIVCKRAQRDPDDPKHKFDILVISFYCTELLFSTIVLIVSIINCGGGTEEIIDYSLVES